MQIRCIIKYKIKYKTKYRIKYKTQIKIIRNKYSFIHKNYHTSHPNLLPIINSNSNHTTSPANYLSFQIFHLTSSFLTQLTINNYQPPTINHQQSTINNKLIHSNTTVITLITTISQTIWYFIDG